MRGLVVSFAAAYLDFQSRLLKAAGAFSSKAHSVLAAKATARRRANSIS
jgi:hypothetical protein